jgi:uncharacterized protein YdeI (YjbR/CyaY-like superfamily)
VAARARVTTTVSAQVAKVPTTVRPIVRAAIKAVKDAAPAATEIAYQMEQPRSSRMMWKLARYAVDGANVVGVGTFADHSTVFFYRGRELDDGAGLLQGSGRDTRFVTLRSAADAERPELRRLIRKAFKLGGTA